MVMSKTFYFRILNLKKNKIMKTIKNFFFFGNEFAITILIKMALVILVISLLTIIISILTGLPCKILMVIVGIAAVILLYYIMPIPNEWQYIDKENKEKFKTANLKSLRGMLKRLKKIKGNTCPYFESEKVKGITEAISLCRYEIKKRKWQRILGKNVA